MFVVPLPTIFPRRGEEEVAGMTGKYAHNIDAKGRLFIPAKLREELGGKNFHLIIGQDMCLSLFSDESWNEKMAALKEQSYSSLKKLRRTVTRMRRDASSSPPTCARRRD